MFNSNFILVLLIFYKLRFILIVLQKLHKQKKHQIDPTKIIVTEAVQDDVNKNEDIDIEDISKNVAVNEPLLQNISVVTHPSDVIASPVVTQVNVSRIMEEPKGIKLMHHYSNDKRQDLSSYLSFSNLSCTICGEGFDYLTLLTQHYLVRHKEYQPLK